ncbi:zf-ZPR1-domain-containing protein [Suillus weaverae]|nr:zf-ZPR1-domain-containing protein [Suillus weaverae]
MLTSIPFFREVIVMSFHCEHCGHSNNEIKSAGKIRPEGTMYTVKVLNRGDLKHQLIRSEGCTINIPEYQSVLPPSCGQLIIVEGLLRHIVADLNIQQPLRRIQGENAYAKIQEIIDDLKEIIADDEEEDEEGKDKLEKREIPFERGSSRIWELVPRVRGQHVRSEVKWNMGTYERSLEQNRQLGLAPPAEDKEENADTLIITTNCDDCAYRDNEIKSGTAISELGKRIMLKVEDRDDLDCDILKSDTSSLSIPEIDLVLHPGTLGGRFTTLEGVLDQVYEELTSTEKVKNAEIPFTLILDDLLASSHVQNLYAPNPDPNMENEDLGLNDMNMESYSGDDTKDGDIKAQRS